MISPEEYFKSIGMDLKTTTVLTVIEGHLRQIDICHHMREFARLNTPVKMDLSSDPHNVNLLIPEYYPKHFNKNSKKE